MKRSMRALAVAAATFALAATADAATPPFQGLVVTGSPAAGTYATGAARFGPTVYDVTAIAQRASGAGDACTPIAVPVSGQIVVADRGNCAFSVQAQNVAAAGGIALVIVDSAVASTPPTIDGTANVAIPVAGITKAAGTAIEAAIQTSSPLTMRVARKEPAFTVTAQDGGFPDQPVGTVGPARRFLVQNTGVADGTVGSVIAATTTQALDGVISGADYLLGPTTCGFRVMAVGDQCTIWVRFAPSSEGDIIGMAGLLTSDQVVSGWAYFTARGLPTTLAAGAPGAKGDPGPPGANGANGAPGAPGRPGRDAIVTCVAGKPKHNRVSVKCSVKFATSRRPLVLVTRNGRTVARAAVRRSGTVRFRLARGRYVLRAGGTSVTLRL